MFVWVPINNLCGLMSNICLSPLWICVCEESKSFSSSVYIIMYLQFMLESSNLQANSFAMEGCSCCLANMCLPLTLEFRFRVFLVIDYIDNFDDIFGTQEDATCIATTDIEMDDDEHPPTTNIGTSSPSQRDGRERATCASYRRAYVESSQHVTNPKS